MPKRHPIPAKIERDILFASDHTCCVCKTRWKDVQIHHLDSNHSNNQASNLAVLCLDCHSRVTGHRGLGKSFSKAEVTLYKRSWERQVATSRQIHQPLRKTPVELINQIDVIICDILACAESNVKRAKESLNLIWELHLWRGNEALDKRIIQGLEHLALMVGLSYPKLADHVAETIWLMCCHFIGPKDVPLGRGGKVRMLKCIDALKTLLTFSCGHSRKKYAINKISKQALEFFEMGIWYRQEDISRSVVRAFRDALKECYEGKKLEYRAGRNTLLKHLKSADNILNKHRPKWGRLTQEIKTVREQYC